MTETPQTSSSWPRFLLKTVFGLLVLVLAMAGGSVWYIAENPISLKRLHSFFEETINLELSGLKVKIGDSRLIWGGWDRAIDIQVENLVFVDDRGLLVAQLPELAVELSWPPLLDGEVTPTHIDVIGPFIQITRSLDGRVSLGFEPVTAEAQQDPENVKVPENQTSLTEMAGAFKSLPFLKELKEINILNASLGYTDYVTYGNWQGERVSASLSRVDNALNATMSLDFEVQDKQSRLLLDGGLDLQSLQYTATGSIVDIPVDAVVAQILPERGDLRFTGVSNADFLFDGQLDQYPDHANLILSSHYGDIRADLRFENDGQSYQADIEIGIPEPKALAEIHADLKDVARINMPMNAKFGIEGEGQQLPKDILLDLSLGNGTIILPELYEEDMALEAVEARLALKDEGQRLIIEALKADLGQDAILNVTGSIERADGIAKIEASGLLTDFTMDRLGQYWSPKLGTNAQEWVTENITQGHASKASIDIGLSLAEDGSQVVLNHMSGEIFLHDGLVQYLKGLPKVRDAKAKAVFGEDWFDIELQEGTVQETTKLTGGRVRITEIGTEDLIDIEIDVIGPLEEALDLLDQEPLGFIGKLGLDPKAMTGLAKTNAKFAFPLLNDLLTEQVEVVAEATVDDVLLTDGPYGITAQSDQMQLRVTNSNMKVTGRIQTKGKALDLVWHENFTDEDAVAQDFHLIGPLTPDLMDIFHVPYHGYFEGVAQSDLRYQYLNSGDSVITLASDLTDSQLNFELMDWVKEKGRQARGEAVLRLPASGGLIAERIVIEGRDLEIRGDLILPKDADLPSHVTLPIVKFDKNLVSLDMEPLRDGHHIHVRGQSLDISPILTKEDEPVAPGVGPGEEQADKATQPLFVDLSVNQIQLDSIIADQVSLTLDYDGEFVESLKLRSAFDGRAALNADFGSVDGVRKLSVSSDNLGAVLRGANLWDRLEGGKLTISGQQREKGSPVEGLVDVGNFTLVKAPGIAKLLEFMSLTGSLSALTSSGLEFTKGSGGFSFDEGVLSVEDGRAYGTSLGLTFEGDVDIDNKTLDLKGTAVPIYTVNRILGAIPILGTLLTGGEGEGLFAATYRLNGKLEDPDVGVNPLSALAPGFLRKLFDVVVDGEFEPTDPPPGREE